MSYPSPDAYAETKKTKKVRGVPARSTTSSISTSPVSSQPLAIALERGISPWPTAAPIGDEGGDSHPPPIVDDSSFMISAVKSSVLDDEVEDSPLPGQQTAIRRRTDSLSMRNPALTTMVKSVSPAPPECTSPPTWPTHPDIVDARLLDGSPPQMYAIYGPVGSDLHASIGELAAPRRISAADALGSIVSGKYQQSPAADRPNSSSVPGRQQAGVYVRSLPSTPEPELPPSPSDSDDNHRFPPRTIIDPPGHTSRPVLAKSLATAGRKAGAALDAISHGMRRDTPVQGPKPILEPVTTRTPELTESRSPSFPSNFSDASQSDILWVKWDSLDQRRLLIMGYDGGGIQIWDVTDLDAVHEVLHLTSIFSRSHPRTGRVLPAPPPSNHGDTTDALISVRPLLGILLDTAELVLYSLGHHSVAKRATFPPASERTISDCDMQVSELFIAVSTLSASHDISVHVLSAYDLSSLHVFHLSPNTVLAPLSLSRRLLLIPLHPSSPSPNRRNRPATLQSGITALKDGVGLAGSMKMEVATTARGVWSGMSAVASNTWSGLIAGVSMQPTAQEPSSAPSKWSFSRSAPTSGATGSRVGGEWRLSSPGGVSALKTPPTAGSDYRSHNRLANGSESLIPGPQDAESAGTRWIGVYDLYPLLGMQAPASPPFLMAHFPLTLASNSTEPSSSPAISALSISPSGALLAAADEDGTVVKIFQLRGYGVTQRRDPLHMASSPRPPRPPSLPPSPRDTYSGSPFIVYGSSSTSRPRRRSSSSSISKPTVVASHNTIRGDRRGSSHVGPGQRNVWHVYNLVRGITRAKVEGVSWAHDERWVSISTAAGTLHIFATNPYGGLTDEDSHVDGRVRNVTDFQPLSTILHPITRVHIRTAGSLISSPRPGYPRGSGPLISPVFPSLSTSLRSTFSPRNVSPPTSANFPSPYSRSPIRPTTGFQDILVTVPSMGRLELHRTNIIPSTKSLEPMLTNLAVNAPPRATLTMPSTSLPSSGLTHMMHAVRGNATSGLRAHQSLKATWDIRKHGEWEDVKGDFLEESSSVHPSFEQDWLSEAELSTGTTSLSMLPDSVYLSHQFSFYSLADDWQALLLRSVFELPCTKIEVRKEVEISPFPSSTTTSKRRNKGNAESFMQGQGNANVGSPFDEPLASAIQAPLDPPPSEPGVIPSYPNGLHVGPNSWRDPTLPLRHAAVGISDGVGEGLKQLRRELVKVAKSPSKNSSVRAPTTLTFDERDAVDVEDADHPGHHTQSITEESSGGSESTLSTANVDPPDIWEEWREAEVANDVAEYEAFESLGLGIVGEMDEDQPFRRPDLAQLAKSKAVPRAGRRHHEL